MLALNPDAEADRVHRFIPGESFDIDEHYEFINVDIPRVYKSGFEWARPACCGTSIVRPGSSFGRRTPACRTS
jgi:hypothetical protein